MTQNTWGDSPLEANALEATHKKIGSSTNKLLYILVTEDPSIEAKVRYFTAVKLDKLVNTLEIIGYEVTAAQSNEIKTWDDATQLVTTEKIETVNMSFPWSRVISIRNVLHKSKSA